MSPSTKSVYESLRDLAYGRARRSIIPMISAPPPPHSQVRVVMASSKDRGVARYRSMVRRASELGRRHVGVPTRGKISQTLPREAPSACWGI